MKTEADWQELMATAKPEMTADQVNAIMDRLIK